MKTFNTTTGNVPFSVDATDNGLVTNLNADMLDGFDATDFMLATADMWVDESGDAMNGDLLMNAGWNILLAPGGEVDGRDVSVDGATLDSHLDGGTSKHDASEIDVEGAFVNIATGDLEAGLADLDALPENPGNTSDNVTPGG